MESLPQRVLEAPRLHVWHCEHCTQPSDLWHWGDAMPPGPPDRWERGSDFPPVLCTTCYAALIFSGERDARRAVLHIADWHVRKQADLPGGTIIRCPEDLGDKIARRRQRYSGELFAVVIDNWDPASVEAHHAFADLDWMAWSDGGVFVILGGYVSAGPDQNGKDIPAGWLILRSLLRPNAPPLCQLLPPEPYPPLTSDQRDRLDKARGAFITRQDPRGRPRGSGRFQTREDFEQAVFVAVAALVKQKWKVTEKSVGNQLIAKRGRNRSERDFPAGPDRQFREWCTVFGFAPTALLQRAVAACANGE